MRNIRQNLFLAFVYNAVGVPVAAGVLYPFTGLLISPIWASAAMTFSSVSVIANALRLRNGSSLSQADLADSACCSLLRRLLFLLPLHVLDHQLVRDVVLVDVGDVGHGFRANLLRRDDLDVVEPDVRVEAALAPPPGEADESWPGRRCRTQT